MPDFKVGDKVKVVTPTKFPLLHPHMVEDSVHVISKITPLNTVELEGYPRKTWGMFRFELVAEEAPADDGVIRVRCIEGKRGTDLRKDQIYTVKKEYAGHFLLNEIPYIRWAKRRFEPVEKKKPIRMVGGSKLKKDEKVMLVKADLKWAGGYLKYRGIDESIVGKPLSIVTGIQNWYQGELYVIVYYGVKELAVKLADLAFYDDEPSITKPVEVKKPELPDIRKYLSDRLASGEYDNNLNPFVWLVGGEQNYREYLNAPCFATFANAVEHSGAVGGAVKKIAVSLRTAYKRLRADQHDDYTRWFSYIYNDSPWASCFVKTSVEDAIENGYELDTNKPMSALVTAAIAVREGYEYSTRLKMFTFLLDEGFSGHVAYLMSWMFAFDGKNYTMTGMINGHAVLHCDLVPDDLFKFLREGYHLQCILDEKPANVMAARYKVCDGIGKRKYNAGIREFAKANIEMKQVGKGKGWNENYVITEEEILKFAALVQSKIDNKE